MLTKIVNGEQVVLSAEDEAEINAEWAANAATKAEYEATLAYKDKRRSAYPPLGDQLDAIYKTFKCLHQNEIDIGTPGLDWLNAIDSIKSEFPKPQ